MLSLRDNPEPVTRFFGLRSWLLLLAAAMLLGAMFHQDSVLKILLAPEGKVAAPLQSSRTQLGDHYYYFITMKGARAQFLPWLDAGRDDDFYRQASGLERVYSGALLLAGGIDALAQGLTPGWNTGLLVSLVVQLAALFAALLALYLVLRGERDIAWSELLLFAFAFAFFSRGVIYGIYSANFSYPFWAPAFYHPDYLRLVNPQMSWTFAFCYLALLVSFYRSASSAVYLALLLLSLLAGVFSVAVCATLVLGLGFYGLYVLIVQRRIDWHLLGIGIALGLSFLYVRYQLHLFHLTDKGAALRTGEFLGLSLRYRFFVPLVVLPLVLIVLPKSARALLGSLYCAALVLGAIGDSFELGGRIWLRGAGVVVHLLLVYALFEGLRQVFVDPWARIRGSPITSIVIVAALTLVVYHGLGTRFDGWYGFVDEDKAEVIGWLHENTGRGDLVLSPDLEDAYLVPLYTQAEPYVQLFDYSALGYEQLVLRYLRVMDLVAQKETSVEMLSAYDQSQRQARIGSVRARGPQRFDYRAYQANAFYDAVLYYPYNRAVGDLFESDSTRRAFARELAGLAEKADAADIARPNYLVMPKKHVDYRPEGYKIRLENNLYQILYIE